MESLDETGELKNVDPPIIKETLAMSVFEDYGWYILILLIALVYAYYKSYPTIQKYLKRKAEDEYVAKYHKDPDLMSARLLAMEQARLKMQEKYNDQLEIHKVKVEEMKKKKQEELLEKYKDVPGGQKLGHSKSFKPEYNPLMGDSSSSYRAPKRKTCGGGGCGK